MTNDSERTQESTIERTDHASGSGPRKGCLTVIQGRADDLGKHVVLGQSVVVGRGAECDFRLKDFGASRLTDSNRFGC